jgi:hypothetical protein
MSRKIFSQATKGALAVSLVTALASPSVFAQTRAVNISLDYGFNASAQYNPAGLPCASVATCDAAIDTPAGGSIGSEDSWGVGIYDTITEIGTGTVIYSPATGGIGVPAGKFLGFMFYGLADDSVTPLSATTIEASSVSTGVKGAKLDVYILDAPLSFSNGVADRTGEDGYTDLTSNPLYLALEFTPGAVPNPTTLLQSTFSTLTDTGGSSAFLDVIGGSGAAFWDTDAETDQNGDSRDFRLVISTSTAGTGIPPGFALNIGGNVFSSVVPVPAPLLLIGAGLLGIAGLRWRVRRG